jgi:hypothetical protein
MDRQVGCRKGWKVSEKEGTVCIILSGGVGSRSFFSGPSGFQKLAVAIAAPYEAMADLNSGPLVALVDADDQFHKKCVAALKLLREPLVTVWPPVTEAVY